MTPVASARMYSVTPAATAAWGALFRRVEALSGVELAIVEHPLPAPLADLWARPDLGCAFMCGWPWVRGVADVVPVAAPLPLAPRAGGRPVYWTDIVVRVDDPARSLAELSGARIGYTVLDSQSGFNALRHRLRGLGAAAPRFGAVVGNLVSPRLAMQAVADRVVDVAPIDSFAHALLRRYMPELASQVRIVAQTEPTPIPLLVASRSMDSVVIARLRTTLLALAGDAGSRPLLEALEIAGFVDPMARAGYAVMEDWARQAGLSEGLDAWAASPSSSGSGRRPNTLVTGRHFGDLA